MESLNGFKERRLIEMEEADSKSFDAIRINKVALRTLDNVKNGMCEEVDENKLGEVSSVTDLPEELNVQALSIAVLDNIVCRFSDMLKDGMSPDIVKKILEQPDVQLLNHLIEVKAKEITDCEEKLVARCVECRHKITQVVDFDNLRSNKIFDMLSKGGFENVVKEEKVELEMD